MAASNIANEDSPLLGKHRTEFSDSTSEASSIMAHQEKHNVCWFLVFSVLYFRVRVCFTHLILQFPIVRRLFMLALFSTLLGIGLYWALTAASSRLAKHQQELNNKGKLLPWNGPPTQIAFIGNSMLYFNDFPRFFEVFSANRIKQNSCLHGGANIPSLLKEGNAMYPQFQTKKAILEQKHGHVIYDYGACTVPQLLTGKDDRLDDPGYAVPEEKNSTNLNPCRQDPVYLQYAKHKFAKENTTWDFILINDNTQSPARRKTRAHSLQILEMFYVPWLLQYQKSATPVFLWTHAYDAVSSCPSSSSRSSSDNTMMGLEDVANFTSLTLVGYNSYVELLKLYLPKSRKPRIAPVGLAFLMVYEERTDIWQKLFHCDHIHASPSGTFLQGCIVYYTLFGEMPDQDYVIRRHMDFLWRTARMMQHIWDPANSLPDQRTAEYLYDVAERIMVEGHVPKSFINYQNGEAVDDYAR